MDETGVYYTEWSKSKRKRQTLYINIYMQNLERWYQQSYMQGRKGNADIKKRILDSVGKGEGGMIWENSIKTCTLTMCKIDDQCKFNEWRRAPKDSVWRQPRGIRWGGKWKRVPDVGTHVHLWPIHVDVQQKSSPYYKVIIFQLK